MSDLLLLLYPRTHGIQCPLLIGEPARLQFRVNKFAVHGQFEATSPRRDEGEVGDLLFQRRQQEARQTESLGLVASDGAVPQFQVHCRQLLPRFAKHES